MVSVTLQMSDSAPGTGQPWIYAQTRAQEAAEQPHRKGSEGPG